MATAMGKGREKLERTEKKARNNWERRGEKNCGSEITKKRILKK